MTNEYRRIQFESLDVQQLPDGRVTARITLAWDPQRRFQGSATGIESDTGTLRCAAEAAAEALELAVDRKISLELLGVRTIKAFDALVVVVALSSRTSDHQQRVVGSAVMRGDPARAAVNAVLGATNRLLGDNSIFLR